MTSKLSEQETIIDKNEAEITRRDAKIDELESQIKDNKNFQNLATSKSFY